uniref:Uncharacterized protein n=1 Tax=Rhizophora mucronata TaxID=61149 RepID=A0A2P2LSK4_RHIMU
MGAQSSKQTGLLGALNFLVFLFELPCVFLTEKHA